jgi:putative membrane protein
MLAGRFRGSSSQRAVILRERKPALSNAEGSVVAVRDRAMMVGQMKPFLLRWLVTTVAVAVAVQLTGMQAEGWAPLVAMALVLGVINAIIRPVLLLLSIPFILVTLGLFILVVNALLFWLAGWLVPGFHVDGFWNAFFGSIIVSVVNWAFSAIVRGDDGHYQILTQHTQITSGGEKVVTGRVVE